MNSKKIENRAMYFVNNKIHLITGWRSSSQDEQRYVRAKTKRAFNKIVKTHSI